MIIFNGYRNDTLFAVRGEDGGHPMEEEGELINIAYAVRRVICDHLVSKKYRVDEKKLYTVSLDRFSETPEEGEALKGITLKMVGARCAVIMKELATVGFATWRDETIFADPAIDVILLDEVLPQD
ncbi:hypothetical protein IKF04_03190 [Candidatus Saccharibacteria bacterium]|nr:hypothetical protein [Candidatus Saccharibacteria bacterium]